MITREALGDLRAFETAYKARRRHLITIQRRYAVVLLLNLVALDVSWTHWWQDERAKQMALVDALLGPHIGVVISTAILLLGAPAYLNNICAPRRDMHRFIRTLRRFNLSFSETRQSLIIPQVTASKRARRRGVTPLFGTNTEEARSELQAPSVSPVPAPLPPPGGVGSVPPPGCASALTVYPRLEQRRASEPMIRRSSTPVRQGAGGDEDTPKGSPRRSVRVASRGSSPVSISALAPNGHGPSAEAPPT